MKDNNVYELSDRELIKAAREKNAKEKSATEKALKEEKARITKLKNRLKYTDAAELQQLTDDLKAAEAKADALRDRLDELADEKSTISASAADESEQQTLIALATVKSTWLKDHPSAAYVIEDEQFVFIDDYASDNNKQNVNVKALKPSAFSELLAADLDLCSWHLPPARVKNVFQQSHRTYQMLRYSVDDGLWNSKAYLPIKHMEPFFIDRLAAKYAPDEYNQCFDWLMYSLSGGKKENQDHIEKWILHKVVNYRKAASTPDLVIVGVVGGNGKGIFQGIIRQMFPASLSGKANAKTLSGDFNAVFLGKLVVHFDDQNTKKIPIDVVKQLSGAETMIFELKGKDQYEAEKTFSACFYNNSLPFDLTPAGQEGGVDRRFSFMRTNITFIESIKKHTSERMGENLSSADAKQWAETIVADFFRNRHEVAKWFAHLQKKHPEVDRDYTLTCLHGEDYKFFLAQQETSIDVVWRDLIAPELDKGAFVPISVIKQLLSLLDGKTPQDAALTAKLAELADQNKYDIEIVRPRISFAPSKVKHTPARKTVIKKKGVVLSSTVFDWSLVSQNPYNGGDLTENDMLFGAYKAPVQPVIDDCDEENILDVDYDLAVANSDIAELLANRLEN